MPQTNKQEMEEIRDTMKTQYESNKWAHSGSEEIKSTDCTEGWEDRKTEQRIDELEQYTCKEDVIISGLPTRHHSYANATQKDRSENLSDSEAQTLEDQVIQFFNKNEFSIQKGNIATCHTLPKLDVP